MNNQSELLNTIRKNNIPNLTDEVTLALRAVTEKRASTITNMVDEVSKLGQDDTFARTAIYNYGISNGDTIRESMHYPNDLVEFAEIFTSGLEANIYEMEIIKKTKQEFQVHFHYCPYVNKWLQMNKNIAELSNLCDICMEGDKAVAQAYANLEFVLGKTIAKGGDICDISYIKKA